jgi:hypothetical protein
MVILDDFILATVIVVVLLILAVLVAPIIFLVSVVLGVSNSTTMTGGAKKVNNKVNEIDNVEKSINTLREKIDLISFKDEKIMVDPMVLLSDIYTKGKVSDGEIKFQKKYIELAKSIYKKEKQSTDIFDIDYKANLEFMQGKLIHSSDKIDISDSTIKKLTKYRTLVDDYPLSSVNPYGNYNVKNIEVVPTTKLYEKKMNELFEFAIIESIRELKPAEEKTVTALVDEVNTGKLTHKDMKANFYDGSSTKINTCKSQALKHKYSDKYVPLHWGQRKLLLSEIDFFSRVAHDMGVDKFKNQEISLVYPGSAHGHHLILEMEMYHNIIMYLWDPAMYNPVLYLAEFMRRKLPLDFPYKQEHKTLADKYVGRIFINMELSNQDFIQYHKNATTQNIPKNYETQWGFFTKKSSDYWLDYMKKNKKSSVPTLYVSDIRLFTNMAASNTLLYNRIKPYSELIPLEIANEKSRHINYIRDMQLQRDWMEFCKADYGLFKFKLKSKRYATDNLQSEYYNGDIVLQVWAPVSSTETRLFVSPTHMSKNGGIAYYNVEKYTNKLNTFNSVMRLHDMSNVKLIDIGVDVNDSSKTMADIWNRFLKNTVMGMDAVLETYMLYDYLLIYKDKKDIKYTDLILMISDITQTLLNHFDYRGILGYIRNLNVDKAERLLKYRNRYHDKFVNRFDYQSRNADNNICMIQHS